MYQDTYSDIFVSKMYRLSLLYWVSELKRQVVAEMWPMECMCLSCFCNPYSWLEGLRKPREHRRKRGLLSEVYTIIICWRSSGNLFTDSPCPSMTLLQLGNPPHPGHCCESACPDALESRGVTGVDKIRLLAKFSSSQDSGLRHALLVRRR